MLSLSLSFFSLLLVLYLDRSSEHPDRRAYRNQADHPSLSIQAWQSCGNGQSGTRIQPIDQDGRRIQASWRSKSHHPIGGSGKRCRSCQSVARSCITLRLRQKWRQRASQQRLCITWIIFSLLIMITWPWNTYHACPFPWLPWPRESGNRWAW